MTPDQRQLAILLNTTRVLYSIAADTTTLLQHWTQTMWNVQHGGITPANADALVSALDRLHLQLQAVTADTTLIRAQLQVTRRRMPDTDCWAALIAANEDVAVATFADQLDADETIEEIEAIAAAS